MPVDKNKPPLTFYSPDLAADTALPLINHDISAGFPSPALDFMEYKLDINKHVARNELSTFYIKVAGSSMMGAGIDDGDLLVIDRSLEPTDGRIAICLIDGEFTVKRLKLEIDCLYLMPENPAYQPIKVTQDNQLIIWAIVTYVIKRMG
jgi:DNA polymerase V